MQGWSAPSPTRVQHFNVACFEGHRLQGQRTEGYQALRCPTCGEGIFVLPRSPLPEPIASGGVSTARVVASIEANYEEEPIRLTDPLPNTASKVVEQDSGPGEDLAEIDWVEEPAVLQTPSPKVTPPPPPRPAARPVTGVATEPIAADPAPAVELVAPFSIRERAWRHRNRLLIVGVILLIVVTVGIRRWRQRLESLPQVAELGRTVGLKKLDDGDFDAAKKLLSDAAAAVDALGGRFQDADAIRQGAGEAAIFTDLATEGLDQILEKAATFRDPKDWSANFSTFYRGRSVILETIVTAVPDPAKPNSAYQVGSYIFAGRGPKPSARGRLDLAGFRLFELAEPKVGDLKTFGARLASLELDPETNVWVFSLEPDSGFLMTHPKALEKVFGSPNSGGEDLP